MIENAALHINGIELCQKLNGGISFHPTLKENDVRRCTMLKLSEECQPPILVREDILSSTCSTPEVSSAATCPCACTPPS
jgi:hypothetical protein